MQMFSTSLQHLAQIQLPDLLSASTITGLQAFAHSRGRGVAHMAAARKLTIQFHWMLRTTIGYPDVVRIESGPRVAAVNAGLTADRQ